MKDKDKKIIVGISQGDINGISYEIIIKTLLDNRVMELCTPIVYGSPKITAYHRKALNIQNFSLINIRRAEAANPKRPNVINCLNDNVRVELGKSTSMAGEASLMALDRATADLKAGKIDVLVTAPINKHNIQSENFAFPGHTEYLGEKFQAEPLMLMVGEDIKIGVVAGHVPVSKIPLHITEENILKKLTVLNESLKIDFAVRKPRIAVLGLNPHAGDNGVLGTEEEKIIKPALENARKQDILALGPFPADGFFATSAFRNFDAILAMYHDQGLAPFKALNFDSGVNFTAGLPTVRTSPAHGTAYEIAGEGKASPNSFRQALYLACDIFKNRQMYAELTANPLQKYENTQNGDHDPPADNLEEVH